MSLVVEAKFAEEDCAHSRVTKPRARTVKGGAIQYRRQCLDCGRPVSSPIARAAVLKETNGVDPSLFDESLFEAKMDERKLLHQLERQLESGEWWVWYDSYRQGEQWHRRRAKVMERCGGLCEGCRDAKAKHVHHLTYKHVGNELLFELVGLCEQCHVEAHKEGSNEPPPRA